MGLQFFAGELKFNSDGVPDPNAGSIRYNYDTIKNSFLSVFILLTGENWNEQMYVAMRAVHPFASIYFVVVIVMGSIIILQLLVAILLKNFDQSHKIAEKRRIIDTIEGKIEEGMNVHEAVQSVLKKIGQINMETGEIDITKVKFGKEKLKIHSKLPTHNTDTGKIKKNHSSPRFLSPRGEVEKRDSSKAGSLRLGEKSQSHLATMKRTIMRLNTINKNKSSSKSGAIFMPNQLSKKTSTKSTKNNSPKNSLPKKSKEVKFLGLHHHKNSEKPLNQDSEEC